MRTETAHYMKVLIVFHSDTGNTERISGAVHEERASDHEVKVRTFSEISPTDLDESALVVVGTPIHAGGLSEPTRDFLERLSPSPGLALAGLVTHASSGFSSENYERGLDALESTAEQNGIRYLGCFDSQGRLDLSRPAGSRRPAHRPATATRHR